MKNLILILCTLFSVTAMSAITEDGNYILDKDHANIGFEVSHLGFSFVVGRFNKFDGTIKFESGGNSEVNFTVEAKSIDTNNKKRDKHLKSEDFFDAETFTTIEFKSTTVAYDENGDPNKITGELLLHGVKKEVNFDVVAIGAGEALGKTKAGYKATTSINRTEFGMEGFSSIGTEIDVSINLEIEKI